MYGPRTGRRNGVHDNVTPGQFVKETAASAPLLKMVDDRVMRVRAEVDERDLQKVCLGQRAKVTTDAFKGVSLTAEVTQVSPRIGRRTIPDRRSRRRGGRDIREVMLTFESKTRDGPLGCGCWSLPQMLSASRHVCPKRYYHASSQPPPYPPPLAGEGSSVGALRTLVLLAALASQPTSGPSRCVSPAI